MRKLVFLSALLMNLFSTAQTSADFKLITGLKDTLFRGFDNEIKIESQYDLSKLLLSSSSTILRKGETDNIYFARVSSRRSTADITLIYLRGKHDTLFFNYNFAITNLAINKVDRHNAALDRPPVDTRDGNYGSKLELLIPQNLPERFDPILISQNHRFAALGNSNTNYYHLFDLKTKKPIGIGDSTSKSFLSNPSFFSNTGRFLTQDIDIYYSSPIALRDMISHQSVTLKNHEKNRWIDYRHFGFSHDDHYFLTLLTDTMDNNFMLVFDNKGNKSYEFTPISDVLLLSSFHSREQQIFICGTKRMNNNVVLIEKKDLVSGAHSISDSIQLPAEPSFLNIQFDILIIGQWNKETKVESVLFYDLLENKMITEIALTSSLQYNLDEENFPISINPERNGASIATQDKDKIIVHYGIFKSGQLDYVLDIPVKYYLFNPQIIGDDILFGQFEYLKPYLDAPDASLFWYDLRYDIYEEYVYPILLFNNGIPFTGKDVCAKSPSEKLVIIPYNYKKGKSRPEENIDIETAVMDKYTMRFGTLGKMGYRSWTNGFFDFNVAYPTLTNLYHFDKYCDKAEMLKPEICMESTKIDTTKIIPEENLLFAYQFSLHQTCYSDELNGGFVFHNDSLSGHESLVRLKILVNHDWILYSDDGYYMAHFSNEPFFQFSRNGEVFPFENFDIKFNRPDIILKRMGFADSLTISAFHNAYLKRLRKLNFSEVMIGDEMSLPQLKITNIDSIPVATDSSFIGIQINIQDYKYKLDRLNVFVNDVPVLGYLGSDLRPNNSYSYKNRITVELAEGKNKIQVSVLNQGGVESYKETIYITYKPDKSIKPNLYVISIGASKYNDNRYDLTYPSKDAKDINLAFTKNKSLYGEIHSYFYTNENVTRDNILKIKEELKNAKRNDVVILFVAGHGVLDDKLDYYLATHDMDFSNPSEKGLPYEELESLLDGIAPLKKVLFLDACHSGEVDKEEVELLATNTTINSKVKFRNAGAGIQNKNLGLKTTSELMSELFTDLRRGTGATVISSAGGAEYAMESDEWKNGLFTYCLLHGLKDKAADSNKDGQIMLSELQNYLRKEVTELSNGAQQPTSRIENLSMDFRIW